MGKSDFAIATLQLYLERLKTYPIRAATERCELQPVYKIKKGWETPPLHQVLFGDFGTETCILNDSGEIGGCNFALLDLYDSRVTLFRDAHDFRYTGSLRECFLHFASTRASRHARHIERYFLDPIHRTIRNRA